MRYIRLLLLIVAIACMFSLTALAAPGDHDLIKVGEAYTLVYETDAPVGRQVVLIMMAGSELVDGRVPLNVAGDISYIDQAAVASVGGVNKVTFSGFIPMDTDKDYHSLYLGGLGEEATYVATVGASGVMVSGKVEYFGSSSVTMNLYNLSDEVIKTAIVTKDEADRYAIFSFSNVPPETYYMKNSYKIYYVSKSKQLDVSVDDLLVSDIEFKIFAGDVRVSKEINFYDLSDLLDDYGKTSGFLHEGSDLNQNGQVNFYDLSALIDGYGEKDI